ncbi:NADPH-dependent oxidoreductase [Herbidospora sp. NEAU-GS84]|uniref:NADPH-dependent oxidoreductase n=1 Tax=Herbidospora solisilvae TaxID=2696284 RepID=A0A7C9NNU0_9ACTN|nr:NAD(P)H-dependent oxidoreductase [Herbidospora solisilvae]NAS27452.1 NADPH-dependent oxidoreductase [Herbidospora solisilvae]
MGSIVTLVGNPRGGSRTLTVAVAAAEAALGSTGDVVDLAGLAPHLFAPQPVAAVEVALDLVKDADVLVVASPTYKGTYTGLLKAFLDRLPPRALAGKHALPLLVMGGAQHALAVEVHFRPLLVELGAIVPTPGLAVLESQLADLDAVLKPWAGQLAGQLPARV